ncbi:MAG TPA: cupin domain-containing protein [Trebonia sp.]|nr:cupin domain-containing protein [Trebonia sp.]
MAASVLLPAAMRRSETPNAVMTTLASPTQGPTGRLSLWKIAMRPGQRGPLHVFDSEQVWHLLAGEADFEVDGEVHRLRAGDAVVLPAGAARMVTSVTATEFIACGHGDTIVSVVGEETPRGTPAWIS